MIEIIPTILVKSFKEVEERIKKIENYVNWAQLDIMDGIFVDNKTWPYTKGEINDLKKLKTKIKLEAHLMVQKPGEVIDDWLKVIDRAIMHFESEIEGQELGIKEMIEKVHSRGREFGLAINPETDIVAIKPFLKDLNPVLIMTVQPGWGGQKFKDWTLEKIKSLRELWPDGNIAVDGGLNDKTAKKAIEAGANIICAGSYIFKSGDIKQAINSLKN